MLFRAVARTTSFSRAAALCHLSTAQVSRRIARLEKLLGAQLLVRSTRQLHLTEAGLIYLQCAEQVHELLESTASAIRDERVRPSGLIRLTSTTTVGVEYLGRLLGEFLKIYPGITINLDLSDQVRDLIAENYDLAIRTAHHLPDSGLQSRCLLQERYVLCTSPSYLKQYGVPETPRALMQHRCITPITRDPAVPRNRWSFSKGKNILTVNVPAVCEVSNQRAHCLLASAGAGIVNVPYQLALPQITAGELQVVLQDYQVIPRSIYLLYPQTTFLPHRVRLLIDFLIERFPADQ